MVNISPSYTCVQESFCICNFSRKSNFLVGGLLFASSINLFICSLIMFHREKTSSIFLSEWAAMKTFVKETALFFHCGILCLKSIWTLKWKEISFKISLSISLRKTSSFPGSLILPPPGANDERPWLGLITRHFDNWEHQGGVLCKQQFVALSFVEFKVSRCDCHYPRRLSILCFQAENSDNVYSKCLPKG